MGLTPGKTHYSMHYCMPLLTWKHSDVEPYQRNRRLRYPWYVPRICGDFSDFADSTIDFDIHGGTFTVQQVIDSWGEIMGNASQMDKGFITLSHDLWPEAVDVNTGYIIPDALAQGFVRTISSIGLKSLISCW